MAIVRRLPSTVRTVIDHGERVYTVEIVPSLPVPRFRPGQFLHLALDGCDTGGFWPESRVFSIASSPDERDRILLTYAVKGAFTTRMEREIKPGREVCIKLPYGAFTVDPGRDVVLFAGGTGITAFTAFLGSLAPDHASRVVLFYGARTPDLFVYGPLAEARAREVASLDVHLVPEATEGRLSVAAAWAIVQELDDPAFYLSGPPEMLVAFRRQLLARGVSSDAVLTDAWE